MDLVYMLKVGNFNHDLKYSLRSVEKYVKGFDKVWIFGYKPFWVQNVEYVKVPQSSSKYRNSLNNIKTICETDDVSDDFVLMNDDFIVHKSININDVNLCLKDIDYKIEKYKNDSSSNWRRGFKDIKELLIELKSEHFIDFEVHAPMIFNKNKMLSLLNDERVQRFIRNHAVLHYRTLYGNMYFSNPKSIKDVKLDKDSDLSDDYLNIDHWFSVYDGVIENPKYQKLNSFLREKLKNKSKFEKSVI